MADFDRELDTSSLQCPVPMLRARKALMTMERGQVLKVISTDIGSINDFEAFSRQTRNPLLSHHEEAGKFIFFLKKV